MRPIRTTEIVHKWIVVIFELHPVAINFLYLVSDRKSKREAASHTIEPTSEYFLMNRTLDYTPSAQKSFNFNLIKGSSRHLNFTIRLGYFISPILYLFFSSHLFFYSNSHSLRFSFDAFKRFDLTRLTFTSCINLFNITMNIDNFA